MNLNKIISALLEGFRIGLRKVSIDYPQYEVNPDGTLSPSRRYEDGEVVGKCFGTSLIEIPVYQSDIDMEDNDSQNNIIQRGILKVLPLLEKYGGEKLLICKYTDCIEGNDCGEVEAYNPEVIEEITI